MNREATESTHHESTDGDTYKAPTTLPPQIQRIDTPDGVRFVLERPPHRSKPVASLWFPSLLLAAFILTVWLFLPIAPNASLTVESSIAIAAIALFGVSATYIFYHALLATLGHVEIVIEQELLHVIQRAGPLRTRETRTLFALTNLLITRRTQDALNVLRPPGQADMPEPASLEADGPHTKTITLASGYPADWLIPLAGALQQIMPNLSLSYNYLNEDNLTVAEDAGPIEPDEPPSVSMLPEGSKIALIEEEDKLHINVPRPRAALSDVLMIGVGLMAVALFSFLIYQLIGTELKYLEDYILWPVLVVIPVTMFCLMIVLPAQRLTTTTRFIIRPGPQEPTLTVTRHGLLRITTNTLAAIMIRSITVKDAEIGGGDSEKQMLTIQHQDGKQLRLLRYQNPLELKWIAAVLRHHLLHKQV
jgi:hypothetical protein